MNKIEYSIKSKLSLSYILFTLMFFIFLAILSNFFIERQFIQYSKEKQYNEVTDIISRVQNQYDGESFNADTIKIIGEEAFDNGFIVGVYDSQNNMIWDANVHHGRQCNMMIDKLYERMYNYDSSYEGKVITMGYKITEGDKEVGVLNITHLSPYFFDESDLSFIKTLNKVYFISSALFILVAVAIASIISRKIARPIEVVTHELKEIEKGNYRQVPFIETNTKEINQLTHSINSLKTTLYNQERLRKQLTSDVSHELRTPLSTLQASLEAMIDGILDVDEQTLTSLHEEINRLTKIVEDLNHLHAVEQVSYKLEKEQFNLKELIESHVHVSKAKLEQKNIKIKLDLENVFIKADKNKLNQVFVNLLENAIKYTHELGQIMISLKEEEHYAIMVIQDNGIGIKEADLPYLFERFYRADKSRARNTGGHGIGLSIVKSIIDAHDGLIEINSTYGNGTEVVVKLKKDT